MGNDNGTFQHNVSYSVGAGASDVAIRDFNWDNKLDIVNTNFHANTISILFGNGDRTFISRLSFLQSVNSPGLVAVDNLNQDGTRYN
ncbi:MAG: FG-GAP repeat domain-containing protein [Candidatus Midichloria sp.]